MSTQPTDYDLSVLEDGDLEDELTRRRNAAGNQQAAARRQEERTKKVSELEAELAEKAAKLAEYERRDALSVATSELRAEGPLNAFLRNYDGDPTPDAIKAALAKDPDFSALVSFPPDPRDEAAAEQARNATLLAGGQSPLSGELTNEVVNTWPEDRRMQFRKDHPDLWGRLLKDEKFPAPTGYA